jgi:hypothetical protein
LRNVSHIAGRRIVTHFAAWLIVLALAASNLFMLAPDGSLLRVAGATLFLLLPGLAWSELILAGSEPLLRAFVGSGIGFACAALAGLVVHAVPGPILQWQWVAVTDLLVLAPLAGLMLHSGSAKDASSRHTSGNIQMFLLAILLLGGVFRLTELDYSEYQGDEIEAVAPAARAIEGYEDALTLQRRKAPTEVLLPMEMWLTTGVLNEGAARLPFAVAGLLLIPCCFFMGRQLLDGRAGEVAGLAAALTTALCGLLIAFSRVVQYQSVALLMMGLSLLCAWEWRRTGAIRWAVLAGVFLGSGLLAHYDALAIVPALAVVIITGVFRRRTTTQPARRRTVWGSLLLVLACMLAAGTFYVPYIMHPTFGTTADYLADRVGSQLLHNNLANYLRITSFYNSFYFVVLTGLLAWIGVAWLLWLGWRMPPWGDSSVPGRRRLIYLGLAPLSLVLWLAVWHFVSLALAASILVLLFAVSVCAPALRAEQRSTLAWAGFVFLAFTFVVEKPGTHIYIIMLPLALLAGVGAAALWDGFQDRRAKRQARVVTTAVLAAAAVMVFGSYLFAAYLRQDVKYWQDWPASRLAFYWMPEEYANLDGFGIFGMVHRSGWKAAGQWLEQHQPGQGYDSNEKPEVTVWYTRNAYRPSREEQDYCGQDPQTLFVADNLVGAAGHYAVAADYLASYEQVSRISQANGKGIAIYERKGSAPAPAAKLAGDALNNSAPDRGRLEADFDRTATPAAFARPVQPQAQINANLGGRVLLLGYDLNCMTPEGRVALTLYWQALIPIKADYHVFVHLAGGLDAGSRPGIYGQSDGVPGDVSAPLLLWDSSRLLAGQQGGEVPLPTSLWQQGQVVRDRRSFQIPAGTPPGRYTLIAGLYDLGSGARLKVRDAQGLETGDYVKLEEVALPLAPGVHD